MLHPERFTPLQPQSVAMRTLLSLTERRRESVGDKTRLTNRLTNTLKQYYPQALDWFEDPDTILFCDFLSRWPTLVQVKRARQTSLKAFFHAHNGRRPQVIGARLEAIKAAVALTEDPGVIVPCRLHALMLVEQLRVALHAIDQFDRAIAELAPTLPDYSLFQELPGAGPHLAPRLLVAFGEDRDRFCGADELQKYAGIAPVFLAQYAGKQPEWGPVGYVTYKRTYARPVGETDQVEEFWQTCQRVVEGAYTVQKWHCRKHNLQWRDGKAQRSAQRMFKLMWEFKFLPGGRGLWMMGTKYVEERGSAALNNCAFCTTDEIDKDFLVPVYPLHAIRKVVGTVQRFDSQRQRQPLE
jgi:hypothetical protein